MATKSIQVPREVFTVPEAMDYLRISRATFYKLTANRSLPVAKLGGRTLIRKSDVDALLERSIRG